MNDLVRLIYCSTMAKGTTDDSLSEILETSVSNNRRDGITGLLAYSEMHFLQLLDGPAKDVNLLYQRLLNDERHSQVTLLYYDQLKKSRFSEWSMQLLEIPEFVANELTRINGEFTPYRLDSQHATEIMEMLRDRFI